MHTPAQLPLPVVLVSQHLPSEGTWVLVLGVPGGHGWGGQLWAFLLPSPLPLTPGQTVTCGTSRTCRRRKGTPVMVVAWSWQGARRQKL